MTPVTFHGTPTRGEGNAWSRVDTYMDDLGRRSRFTVHCLSHDTSPMQMTYPEGYDERCDCCWLGFSHTQLLHQARSNR
jgi:hypothetical protein